MGDTHEEKTRKSKTPLGVKKKAYAAPKLTEYGTVEKLTGIKSHGPSDGAGTKVKL